MTAEQRFYQQFRKALPRDADCVRIETSTESGMPDVNICHEGREIWVELKVFVEGRVLIRKEQQAWGFRRSAACGKVYILAKHPSGIFHCWLFPHIDTIVHGKYLWITNGALLISPDMQFIVKSTV